MRKAIPKRRSRDEMIEKARMLMRFGGVSEPDGVIAAILNLPQARTLPRLPGSKEIGPALSRRRPIRFALLRL